MKKCVLHKGKPTVRGYGQKKKDGVTKWAHRWAWIERFGPIPKGLVVMHLCDKPLCVNINHLALGTQAANIRDCVNKGRFPFKTAFKKGTRHWNARLTETEIALIRKTSLPLKKLAKYLNVNYSTVYRIRKGERHVPLG